MIYHQFISIQTLFYKVCYGFQYILISNMVHTLELSFINKFMCTEMGHHFYYLIWDTK